MYTFIVWSDRRKRLPASKRLVNCGVHRHGSYRVVQLSFQTLEVHLGKQSVDKFRHVNLLLCLSVVPHCQQTEAPSRLTQDSTVATVASVLRHSWESSQASLM